MKLANEIIEKLSGKELFRAEKVIKDDSGDLQLSSFGDDGGILAITQDVDGMQGPRTSFNTLWKISLKAKLKDEKGSFTPDGKKADKKLKKKIDSLIKTAHEWLGL